MTTENTAVVDSWESRLQKAAEILGITTQEVEDGLKSKSIGIEKEPIGLEMLSDEKVFRFVDFSNEFGPDGKGIAMGRVRMSYEILNGSKVSNKTKATEVDTRMVMLKEKFGLKGNIGMVPVEELLSVYKPDLPADPITQELKKRLGDAKVVVFKLETEEVSIEDTIELVRDLEQGFELPRDYMVDGQLVDIYAIGEMPDRLYDEDPLVPGEALRRGRSNATRIDWTNISQEVRQFCRLCLETKLVDTSIRRDLVDLLGFVRRGMDALRMSYPEADKAFREHKKMGTLPSLKMKGGNGNSKVNDPFATKRRY